MAKLPNLTILNNVLTNLGEPTVSVLTSLSGIQLVAYNAVEDVIREVAFSAKWRPLESTATVSLITNTNTYAEAAGLIEEDVDSFIVPDNTGNVEYLTPTEWSLKYPKGVGTATTGYPTAVKREGGNLHFNKMPGVSQNGKTVKYAFWTLPSTMGTATTTTTCWFPEGTEQTVLVNLATYKVLHYKNNPEAQIYWNRVYGQPYGTYEIMRKRYSTDQGRLKARVTYIF